MKFSDIDDIEPDESGGYVYSLEMLVYHVHKIPSGWCSIYEQCIESLMAISCPKRSHYRLRAPETDLGILSIGWHDDARSRPDGVVRGILRKMQDRSRFCCEVCGRAAKFTGKPFSARVLCPRCSAKQETRSGVDFWLRKLRNKFAVSMMDPVIAFRSLPICMREMIPPDAIRILQVKYDSEVIEYVTAIDIQKLRSEFEKIQTYLSNLGENLTLE